MSNLISCVINADTRPGQDAESFTVGDDGGQGSLHGCRSWDFLTDGVLQKVRFFAGYPLQLIVYVDVHDPIPPEIEQFILGLVSTTGNNSMLVCKSHDRTTPHWNDKIMLEALKLAEGEIVAHFDQDCNALQVFPCIMVDRFIELLRSGTAKFVCQPSDMKPSEHGMWWASTRFFMCLRETLDFPALEDAVENPTNIFRKYPWGGPSHLPCLEHILGVMAGAGGVFYPPRNDNQWLVWSWARYRKGLLKRLNEMPYADAVNYVTKTCGLCGPMDCLAKEELP